MLRLPTPVNYAAPACTIRNKNASTWRCTVLSLLYMQPYFTMSKHANVLPVDQNAEWLTQGKEHQQVAAQLRKQGSANCVLCGLLIRKAEPNHASTCCRRRTSALSPPRHPKSIECILSSDVNESITLHVLPVVCMLELPLLHAWKYTHL